MSRVLVLVLVLVLCVLGCASTGRAGLRRQAESQFQACMGHQSVLRGVHRASGLRRQCIADSRDWCLSNGMERDCGLGGLSTGGVR